MKDLNGVRLALLLLAGASHAFGSLVMDGPMMFDQPITSFPTLLTIRNAGTASGCVGFLDGETITGPAACPGGFTGLGGNELTGAEETGARTIGELAAAGVVSAAALRFAFNSGEAAGGPLTIEDLALTFFNAETGSSFTASLLGTPVGLSSTLPGSGPDRGFAFRLDALQAGFAQEFFPNADNRVGAAVTISGSSGGRQTFFVAPVPEPGSIVLLPSALAVLWLVRRRLTC
jgi:hypothetical protein